MFAPCGRGRRGPGDGLGGRAARAAPRPPRRIAFGDEIEIVQGVEIGRPSKLYARVDGSAERIERVEVGGSAVVVARGEFRLYRLSISAGRTG